MATLKTLFLITISTARLVFPGIPAATGVSETAKPPAARSISLELASDATAGKDSNASVAVPDGLKAGKSVDLQIDASPKPAAGEADSKVTLWEYWGSGQQIAADQPKVGHPKSTDSEAAASMPTNSYASWPTMDSKPLADDAAIAGTYALKTNYCGGTAVTLTKDQELLSPVNITSADSQPDLTKPITVKWKPVANAVGYLLRVYGGQDSKTITWTSAAKPELAQGIEYKALSKDDVDSFVKSGVLIPSYVISSTIPAGIFKDSSSVMLVLTAFGKDMDQTKDGIETQVIVRSTASVPLHSQPFGPPPAPKNANRVIPED